MLKEPYTLNDWLAEEAAKDPEWIQKFNEGLPGQMLGNRLALRREDLGLTQAELAKRSGIKQPMVSRIERGQEPTLRSLRRLAQSLDAVISIRPDGSMLVEAAEPSVESRSVQAVAA